MIGNDSHAIDPRSHTCFERSRYGCEASAPEPNLVNTAGIQILDDQADSWSTYPEPSAGDGHRTTDEGRTDHEYHVWSAPPGRNESCAECRLKEHAPDTGRMLRHVMPESSHGNPLHVLRLRPERSPFVSAPLRVVRKACQHAHFMP